MTNIFKIFFFLKPLFIIFLFSKSIPCSLPPDSVPVRVELLQQPGSFLTTPAGVLLAHGPGEYVFPTPVLSSLLVQLVPPASVYLVLHPSQFVFSRVCTSYKII